MVRCARRSLLAIAALCAAAGVSHAAGAPAPSLPPDGSGWIHVHAGLSFRDAVQLENVSLESDGAPAPVFGIGAHYRLGRFDLGVLAQGLGSFHFQGLTRTRRVGGQLRIAADLRWRYVDAPWGALFIKVTPGLMAFAHSDDVRTQIAGIAGGTFEDVPSHSFGFGLGFAFGLSVHLTRHLTLSADLDVVGATSSVAGAEREVDFVALRGVFRVALEWRM